LVGKEGHGRRVAGNTITAPVMVMVMVMIMVIMVTVLSEMAKNPGKKNRSPFG
jgi:hypothetical protein